MAPAAFLGTLLTAMPATAQAAVPSRNTQPKVSQRPGWAGR